MAAQRPQGSPIVTGSPQPPFGRADGGDDEDASPERRMMDDPDLGEDEPDDDDGPHPEMPPAFDPKSP